MIFGKKDDELIPCDKCGTLTRKSKLKRCKTCGMVLCRKCRRHHVCEINPEIKTDTSSKNYNSSQYYSPVYVPQTYDDKPVIHVDIQTGHTIFRDGGYCNPQCVIKITDMRIYEIARNPSIMTQEEEITIYNDSDIHRRYMKYREEIREKGY